MLARFLKGFTVWCIVLSAHILASVTRDCNRCTSRTDVKCRIEVLAGCILPGSLDTIWPGGPRRLSATQVKDGDRIVANITWRLPFDSSYLEVRGFLLEVFVIRNSPIIAHRPSCYFYNLTATNWSDVNNPHDVVFKFDCLKFRRPAQVILSVHSIPKPVHSRKFAKMNLLVHGIDTKGKSSRTTVRRIAPIGSHLRHGGFYTVKDHKPCSAWRPSTRVTVTDVLNNLKANVRFKPYSGAVYEHLVIILDSEGHTVEQKTVRMPNHSVIFTMLARNKTYTAAVRPRGKSGYLVPELCRSHPFITPAERPPSTHRPAALSGDVNSHLTPTLLVMCLVVFVTIVVVTMVMLRRRRKRRFLEITETPQGLLEEQSVRREVVTKSGAVAIFCSENQQFVELVDAFIAFLRRFTRTHIVSHTDRQELPRIRSSIDEWVSMMHLSHHRLLLHHPGLALLYSALRNGREYPNYNDVYKKVVLRHLELFQSNTYHENGECHTVVKLCPVLFEDNFLESDLRDQNCFENLWIVGRSNNTTQVEFNDRELENLLLSVDKLSGNRYPISINIEECKQSHEGRALKERVLRMIYFYENNPNWIHEAFGCPVDRARI